MNILIFTTDYKPARGSGIANLTTFLAGQWDAMGETVVVLAPKAKGYKEFDRLQNFATYRFTNILVLREITCFFMMLYILRKHAIQTIVNMIWLPGGALSFLLNLIVKIPYHVLVYGADIVHKAPAHPSLKHRIRSRMRGVKQKVFKNASKVFAISGYTKQLLKHYAVSENKIRIVYPACVPFTVFHPSLDGDAVKSKFAPGNEKLILSVGRMDFYKGHDGVIRALSTLRDKTAPFHYVLIGKGPEKHNLQNLVRTLHMESHVSFAGEVNDRDLPLYYAACDLFVFPSLEIEEAGEMEGFGIVLVEAMACKKPVISGISGGTREVVIHEESGLLVNAGDTEKLAGAIKRMLCDEPFARKMAENGYNRAREIFDGQKIAKTFLDELKKIYETV